MTPRLDFAGRRRTPLVRQSEAAECGLACLAMVLGHHGHRIDMPSLRQRCEVSLKGTDLARLIDFADRMELTARAVKVPLSSLAQLALPAILHWDLNHFVVLSEVRRGRLVVLDPARGRLVMHLSEASAHFTGVALELAPAIGFSPRSERRRLRLRQLAGGLPSLGRALAQIILLATLLELFVVAAPFYLQLVVDSAVVSEDRDLLTVLAVGFLLLLTLRVGVTALRAWVVMVLSTTLNVKLAGNLFRHLLRLPLAFFGKRHLGDLVSRFESLEAIQRTLTTTFVEALLDGLMIMASAAMMFWYDTHLALIVVTAALGYGLLRLLLFRPLRRAQEDSIMNAARQQSSFLESVRAVQCVKLFNREPQRIGLYRNRMIETFNANIRAQKLGMLAQAANGLLFGVENVLVVWLAAIAIMDNLFSVGMLFAFLAYKQQFTSRVGAIVDSVIDFKMLDLHLDRVGDIALTEPEPAAPAAAAATPRLPGYAIEVRDVSFSYAESEPPVLRNVSLTVAEGESVAIVAPSGSGKSTLLKIMLGLLPPNSGEVLLGGAPLARLPVHSVRAAVGTVMQDDHLLAGSIGENICFFDPDPDGALIRQCAALASIHHEIEAMPMAYSTLVGDLGTVLSGGQKQRVLLARALYRRPRILFLDEATSHLDAACERSVNAALRQLSITRVFIAHRAESIACADRVIVLGQSGGESAPPQSIAAA